MSEIISLLYILQYKSYSMLDQCINWFFYTRILGITTLNKLIILFFIYSMMGWVLETLYRSFDHKKIINPGFLTGPLVPLYGFIGIAGIFLVESVSSHPLLVRLSAYFIFVSLIEYIAGELVLILLKRRLWDYRDERFNIRGHVSLKFSLYWLLAAYVFEIIIYPYSMIFITKLSEHTIFSINVPLLILLNVDILHSSGAVSAPFQRLISQLNSKFNTPLSIAHSTFMKYVHEQFFSGSKHNFAQNRIFSNEPDYLKNAFKRRTHHFTSRINRL